MNVKPTTELLAFFTFLAALAVLAFGWVAVASDIQLETLNAVGAAMVLSSVAVGRLVYRILIAAPRRSNQK